MFSRVFWTLALSHSKNVLSGHLAASARFSPAPRHCPKSTLIHIPFPRGQSTSLPLRIDLHDVLKMPLAFLGGLLFFSRLGLPGRIGAEGFQCTSGREAPAALPPI